jgi:hypothetical protein
MYAFSRMPIARWGALLIFLIFGFSTSDAVSQNLERHGEVTATDGQEVTVQLREGLSVSAGTEGTIYTTTTVGGEDRSVRVAQVEVTGAEGRRVTAEITNQTEAPEVGFAVSLEAVQRQGTLALSAEPTSAELTLNGNQIGRGPVRTPLPPGEHVIGAAAEGYRPARRELTIEAGQTREIRFDLQEATGKLVVVAVPDDARIQVDGRAEGRGSILKSVSPGQHKVSVRAGAHAPFDTTVSVEARGRARVRATLSQKTGQISVVTKPTGAEVLVQETGEGTYEKVGEAPLDGHRLEQGTYSVMTRRGAFRAPAQEVKVVPGGAETIRFRLEFSMGVAHRRLMFRNRALEPGRR